MKKIKYLVLFWLLWVPISVYADTYEITNYYIDVHVDSNNIYNITEYYNLLFARTANFSREIQLRPKVYLTNGKFISYIAEVTDIEIDAPIKTNQNSKQYKIDFLEELNGSKSYILSYQYNMGNDLDNNNDLVFVNIVDGTMHIISPTIEFSLTIPMNVAMKEINFYKNGKILENDKIKYTVEENHITGMIYETINEGDIISARIVLPEGFFNNTIRTDDYTSYFILILPIITFFMSLWGIIKYKNQRQETLKMQELDCYDSAEISYLYRGSVKAIDLISLIFVLANQGYLSLKKIDNKDNPQFKIQKEKEYDKDNAAQKIVFDGLFQHKDEVDIHSIEGTFRPYYIDASRTLQNKRTQNILFHKWAKQVKSILLLGIYIGICILQIKPLYCCLNSNIGAIISSCLIGLMIILQFHCKNKVVKTISILLSTLWFGYAIYQLLNFRLDLWLYIGCTVLLQVSLFIETSIPIRTTYGKRVQKAIESFRLEFLTMQEETFTHNMKQNPNYFFDMLPYMIIFNLHGWWFRQFGKKIIFPPLWYKSSELYTSEKMYEFIEQVIEQLETPIQMPHMYNDELLHQAPNKLL